MSDKIICRYSSYIIPEYEIGDCKQLEMELSVRNARYYRYDPVGFIYNEETKELRIPGGYPHNRLAKLLGRKLVDDEYPNPCDKLNIKMTNKPRDDKQVEIIKFLCGLGDKFKFSRKYSQLFCDLRTRFGKTYCAISAVSFYKEKAIVLVSSRRTSLMDQWKEEFIAHSDIEEDDIVLIKGSDACKKVCDGKYKDKKVFIIGRATVLSFAKKEGWDEFERLVVKTRAGIKIIDEAHEDFTTINKLDCYSNTKRTFYFTSSAARSNFRENEIFKKLYDEVPIKGMDLITEEDNYLIVVVIMFSHKPSQKQRIACKTIDGLSSSLYSSYLIDKEGARIEFFNALNRAMIVFVEKYLQKGAKVLILGSTKELLRTISKFLSVNHSKYTVGMYTSDTAKKNKEDELNNDIILATEKSCGTGKTVEGLQIVINVIPYSTGVYADQLSGRIGFLDKESAPLYIEIVNKDFSDAFNQYEKRKKYLSKKARKGTIVTIDA